jgi:hypothetical protein
MIYLHEKLTKDGTPRVYLWPSEGFYSTYVVVDENVDKLIDETFFRAFLLHNAILFTGNTHALLAPINKEGIESLAKYFVNSSDKFISLYVGDDKAVNHLENLKISDCSMCVLSQPSEIVKFITDEKLNILDDYLNGEMSADECTLQVNQESEC